MHFVLAAAENGIGSAAEGKSDSEFIPPLLK